MSFTVNRESKPGRGACQICRNHRDQVLCFECHRSKQDRRRALLQAYAASLKALVSPFGCPNKALTDEKISHRRRMLQHLTTAGPH